MNDKTIIDAAMNYDISDVMERYAEDTRLPTDALAEHEREIKRFLALCAIKPGKIGMRGPLDELWHTFIFFTSSYAKFCRTLGEGFIHHLPERPSKIPQKNGETTSYDHFLVEYEKTFGEEAPVHLWPRPLADGRFDPGCNRCGGYCARTCVAMELGPDEQRY